MTVRTTTVRTMPPVWMGSTTTRACAHLITQVTIEGDALMPVCLWGRVGLRMSLRERGFLSDILKGGGRQREVPPPVPSLLFVLFLLLPLWNILRLSHLPVRRRLWPPLPACWRLGREVWSQLGLRLVLEICPPCALLGAGNAKLSKSPVPSQKRLRVRPRNMSLRGRKSRGQEGCETTAENLPGRRIHRRLPWEEFLWNVFPPTHRQNPTPLFPTSTNPHENI